MFFPIGAMLSGDPTRSFQQAADNKLNFEGMQAAGKALQLAQGGTPPTAQTGFLESIFGGGGGAPGGGKLGVFQRLSGMGGPFSSTPGLGAPGMTGASPASPGMPPAGSPPPGPQAGMPQQPAPLTQPAMSPMGPGGGAGSPISSWQQALQMVARANPGAPPAVIAMGAQQLLKTIGPGMQMDAMSAYRMGSLGERAAHDRAMEDVSRQRAATAATAVDTRADIAADVEAGRQERFTQAEAGRQQRADTRADTAADVEAGRQQRFEAREQRLQIIQSIHNDQRFQQLEIQRQRLEQQIRAGDHRQATADWRAILDAQHKLAMEKIQSQAAGMGAAERKALIEEETKSYNDAIVRIKQQVKGAGEPPDAATPTRPVQSAPGKADRPAAAAPATIQTGPAPPSAPMRVQTPEEAQKLKPGTRYITPDGQEYTR